MSQQNKHPKLNEIELQVGKDSINVFSTLKTKTNKLLMEVDFRDHPAWNKGKGNVVNTSNKKISAFKSKFAGFTDFMDKK